MSQNESVIMHCTKGGSDKIYAMQLVGEATGEWSVFSQNGRRIPDTDYLMRGQQSRTLLSKGTYADAHQFYLDTIFEKRHDKGYQIVKSSSGAATDTSDASEKPEPVDMETGPMLLTAIETEEEALRLCRNPSYMAQEKEDGERRLLKRDASGVIAINRKDEATVLIPRIGQTTWNLGHSLLIDGEEVGDILKAFDLLELDGENLRGNSAKSRWQTLAKILALSDGDGIRICQTAFTTADKLAMFERIKREKGEGMVFKMAGASYEAGKSKKALKFKFKGKGTFVVEKQNVDGKGNSKRSVALFVKSSECGPLISIGNCTIPANQEIPCDGSFVTIEYLYAYPNGGSLFQPVYKGPRTDVGGEFGDKVETINTLKYRQGTALDEEDDA